jgi:hypothetical protein
MLPAQSGSFASPARWAFVYVPNGIHMEEWTPKKEGSLVLSELLAPLRPMRSKVSVLSGLTQNNARALGDGPGDHARAAASFLTGAHPRKTAGSDIHVGVSIDQVLASRLGTETRYPSLEFGTEPGRQSGQCDSGYSCAYSSTISWRSSHTPNASEVNPRLVFDRLFLVGSEDESDEARVARLRTRRSILDFVLSDARRLRAQLGTSDRRKVDEYFEAVREVEKRLEAVEKESRERRQKVQMNRPTGIPSVYSEHLRLMFDLMVVAFRLDLTRVITFMLANEGSNRTFPEIDVAEGHHYLSHHGGDPEKHRQIQAINRLQVEQLAYFLEKLEAAKEDGQPLLDSCTVIYGSGIGDGNRHNHNDLPVLLAGKGNGAWRLGQHRRFPDETPLCNLFQSMLQRAGVQQQAFGDATGLLEEVER